MVLTATFMQLVDVSIVNVAIPPIQRDLDASYGTIQLVVAGYQLTFASILITAARLGDIYGRKRIFIIGMVGFTLASAACGAAPNGLLLVAGRLVQGLASGLMYPQVLSVIQVEFSQKQRGKAFSILGAVVGLATIVGPVLGGVLITWSPFGLGWRSVFYVNVPIGIVAAVAAVAVLRESRAPDAPGLDLPGVALATVALFLLVFPLSVGQDLGWPWWVLVMLGAAVPVLAVFAVYEQRRTRRRASPLVRMSLFADRSFRVGMVVVVVFFSGVGAFFFITTLYLQVGFGFSPLHAGLTTFPFAVGSGTFSLLSDRFTRRYGKRVLQIGAAVLVLGMVGVIVAVNLAGTALRSGYLVPAFLVAGSGLGLFVAPLINLVLRGTSSEAAGSASGILATGQRVGSAMGVAAVGALLFGLLGHNAAAASDTVVRPLRDGLAEAGLSAQVVERVAADFPPCFTDTVTSGGGSQLPLSCQRLQDRLASLAATPEQRRDALREVQDVAIPAGLRLAYSASYQQAILYQVAVWSGTFLLVFALPRVRGASAG